MKKLAVLILSVSLLLGGCSWMDGSYVHITRHQDQGPALQSETLTVSNYTELQQVIMQMVESGTTKGVIFLSEYAQTMAEDGMALIQDRLATSDPLGAYAVEHMEYEIGTNNGKPAIAVEISYRRTPMEIQQIQRVTNMEQATRAIAEAMSRVDTRVVLLIARYEDVDFAQLVNDYAQKHPDIVMEIPQVTTAVYGTDRSRVVDLQFTYQTSRDILRQMRRQVEPVFEAAQLYVSEDATDYQKYAQLYAFLMERFDYRIQSSITPTYSLLHHGVGDSRAFAVTYAAMCRSVGLDCLVMTGTRNGEPRTWNLISLDGNFVHVDLLQCTAQGSFQTHANEEMLGYVWDYSAIPGQYSDPSHTPKLAPVEIN